jgi:hypothetical protein
LKPSPCELGFFGILGIHFGGYGIKVLVRTDPGCGVGDWQRNCGIDDAMAPGIGALLASWVFLATIWKKFRETKCFFVNGSVKNHGNTR